MLALIDHAKEAPPSQPDVAMIALFDHEEVGSGSAQGACSTVRSVALQRVSELSRTLLGPFPQVMSDALQRVSSCFAPDERHASVEALSKTARRSFLMAADLAHAVHPNYAEKHEKARAAESTGAWPPFTPHVSGWCVIRSAPCLPVSISRGEGVPHFLFVCLQEHAPKLNSGTVIKSNDNQRYATNDATGLSITYQNTSSL